MTTIFAWSDGTWCEESELEEYNFMSDDHQKIEVPDYIIPDDMDEWISLIVNPKPKKAY